MYHRWKNGMRYLFVFLFLFSFLPLLAQQKTDYSTDSKRAIKLYQEANLMIRRRVFDEAIELLNKAVKKDNKFIEAHLKLAFCYEILRNLDKQQYHLEQVVKYNKDESKYKNVLYTLARVYFAQGKYEEASKTLNQFKKYEIDNDRLKNEFKSLESKLNFVAEHKDEVLDIEPKPVSDSVNAFELQYFPVLTADEQKIFFTRRLGQSFADDEDIYYCERDEDGNWHSPKPVSPNINSRYNEGTCTISADGRVLIFTTCDGRPGFGGCDLYMSEFNGEEWSEPQNLGSNVNSRSWESQPSLSADGRTLYFVSDRAGGEGRRDIWVTEIGEDGNWLKAWNAGKQINTREDEVSPFIHVNGTTLFFASKGWPGYGKFDLFYVEKTSVDWTSPKNLGYPINDHNDQVSLFVTTDGENAYYVNESKKNGIFTESRIYTYEIPKEIRIDKRSNYLKGKIFAADTKKPLEASIELFDLEKDERVSKFKSKPQNGEYFAILTEGSHYALYVESPGYLFESRSFDYRKENFDEPVIQNFYLNPIKRGEKTVLNNIYFDFDSYKLKESSRTELEQVARFIKQHENLNITIAGHTDNVGEPSYNQKLSENRAREVYEYLLSLDVNPDKLAYNGYGQEQPLFENDTEEHRSKNRRIEFIIE